MDALLALFSKLIERGEFRSIVIGMALFFLYRVLDTLYKRFRDSMDRTIKIKGVVKRDEVDKVVSGLLDGTMGTLDGDRIQVVEFTNSVKNVALVPYLYMTCTYESCAVGKRTMSNLIQNVPTSLVGLLIKRLSLSKVSYVILDLDNRDPALPAKAYELLDQRMATKCFYVPLCSPLSKKIIGFICYDTNDVGDFSDKVITLLRGVSGQIGTLLTLGEWA